MIKSLKLNLSINLLQLRNEGNVFATDDVLATLMSCTRSIYSWDIIVNVIGNRIFLDKRDNSNIS